MDGRAGKAESADDCHERWRLCRHQAHAGCAVQRHPPIRRPAGPGLRWPGQTDRAAVPHGGACSGLRPERGLGDADPGSCHDRSRHDSHWRTSALFSLQRRAMSPMERVERFGNYIAGRWVEGATWSVNRNPSDTRDVIGEYAQANEAQVEEATEAARAAFPVWSNFGVQERSEILDRVGNALLARREELGRQLAREEGRALPDALAEVGRAAQIFKFFAGEALRLTGELIASTRPGVEVAV